MDVSVERTPNRREKQRLETRERIFEAGVAELRRVGFAEAQIPRIAAAAGVVRGTFYFHFPSKEHLLRELFERSQSQLTEALVALHGRGAPLRDILWAMIDGIAEVDRGLGGQDLMRDLLAMYVRSPAEPDVEEGSSDLVDVLTEHIGAAAGRGELRGDVEPERLAATVLTSLFGSMLARREPGTDLREELELLMDVLLEGMGPDRGSNRVG
jgi:TetR/AcrR family transcriptional repressor of uid operon